MFAKLNFNIFENNNLSIFALAPGAIQTKMLQKVLKKTSVRTKTSKKEILKFISYCLEFDSSRLNGRLIHIRDDKLKIEHNKNNDYLNSTTFLGLKACEIDKDFFYKINVKDNKFFFFDIRELIKYIDKKKKNPYTQLDLSKNILK